MAQLADAFTDTDGVDLFSHVADVGAFNWTNAFSGASPTLADINSNAARFYSPNSLFSASITPRSFTTNDQWAEITYSSLAGTPGVFVRGSYDGDTSPAPGYICYRAEHYSDGKVYLSKVSLLSRSLVGYLNGGTGVAVTGTSGTLRIEANGTTITVYFNGVAKITVTDSSITTGRRCGIWCFPTSGNNCRINSFNASDANVTTATSYTFSGPSIGAISTASSNFTISPIGGDWPVGQTISLASTGSGTFSQSNPIATSGSTPITVTYTPSSQTGSPHTISVTASPTLGTNPASLSYTVVAYTTVSTVSPNGQALTILVPVAYSATAGAHLLLYAHSNNGSSSEFTTRANANWAAFLDDCIAKGYIICGSALNGNNWGNDASLASMVDMYAYLVTHYRCLKTLLWSQSMGGLASLLAVNDDRIPRVKGWMGVLPVCNLADMFDSNSGTYASGIRTAYGIASDGSDYAALTAGHDPVLLSDLDAFANKGFMWISSPDDTVVNEAANSTAMHDLIEATAYEATQLHTTGDHSSANSYAVMLDNAPSFFERCLAIPDGTGSGNTNTAERQLLREIVESIYAVIG